MKAKYEKPELGVIDLNLNTVIAATCATTQPAIFSLETDCQFLDIDNPFAEDSESCQTKANGYCYYTSATIIFAS